MDIAPVLKAYGLSDLGAEIAPFGTGLINSSWKVSTRGSDYLVQRINDFVFKQPQTIRHNINEISSYLSQHNPDYFFVAPVRAADGNEMIYLEELGYFRAFPFVQGSHTVDVVQTPEQAFEAALQFGRFSRVLSHFDAGRLQETIPGFHDLNGRYLQYANALKAGNSQRLQQSKNVLNQLNSHQHIVERYKQIGSDPAFQLRAAHHDTKISNVLFDESEKGICVIDLDTVMPGYFISDVGDMMRTYLSPVSEEEPDLSRVQVRKPFYEAIAAGYMQEMQAVLSAPEQASFFYAGQFMIYMQSLRFITDFLNNDVYYGARYPDHNLVRAKNQLALLQQLILLEKELKNI